MRQPLPRFLYAATASGTLQLYQIDYRTGALSLTGSTPAGTNPYFVSTDPASQFLLVSAYGSNQFLVFSIDPASGQLTQKAATSSGMSNPVGTAADPGGRFAYIVNNSAPYNVSMYSISASGSLTALSPATTAVGTLARYLLFDPQSRFAFVINTNPASISQLAFNQNTGVLSANGSFALPGTNSNGIALTPSGQFLYAANYTLNTISMLSVDGNGQISLLATTPAGANGVGLRLDPSGKFAYAGIQAGSLTLYAVHPTGGTLTDLGTVSTGASLNGIGLVAQTLF